MTNCYKTSDLYPDVQIYEPMKYLKTPKDASSLMASGNYIAQPKKDGYWYALTKTKNGQVYLFSRSDSKKTHFPSEKIDNVPHLKEWAEQIPNDTILIGEIYYPNGTSKTVTTIMGCLPEKAIQRQSGEMGLIHYYIHDILRWNGEDYVVNAVPFERRYSNLCEFVDIDLTNPEWIEVAISKTGFDMENCIVSWMNKGEEGAVVKLKSGLYLPGKRTRENFKVKQHEDTLDFVITGFVEPERDYTGKTDLDEWPYWEQVDNWIRDEHTEELYNDPLPIPVTKAYYHKWKMGFTIGLYDGDHIQEIGKVTSGLTDELRADIAANPNKYLGEVIKVSCMSIDKEALSLRHPVFEGMHTDKPAGDCRLEDIF